MKARIIVLFMAVALLSGCGMFRKVFKTKEYSKLEMSSRSSNDSTGRIIDKSTTTVKEKIDTTITIPGQVVQQDTYLNLDSLVNGITAIKSDIIDVTLHLNPITGILSAVANIKHKKVPVKMDRETTKQNDITQQSYQSGLWENALKQSSGSSSVEKDPVNITWNILGVIAGLAAVFGIVYWLRIRF